MNHKLSLNLILLMAAVEVTPLTALAHAHLHSAEPSANAVISQMPAQLSLHFTEALEVPLSKVEVKREVDSKLLKTEAAAISGDPKSLVIQLLPESSRDSRFTVNWKVVSKDGHKMNGTYQFTLSTEKRK